MSHDQTQLAVRLNAELASLQAPERLAAFRAALTGRIVFTTSLGVEDQAIAHMIAGEKLDIELATLDTGRLFPETYDVWQRAEEVLGVEIKAFYPDATATEALVSRQGVNGFYNSTDAGLRADQSEHRGALDFVAFDAARGLLKLNPIFDWTRERVVEYVEKHAVPVNALHAKGFVSIGCAPCTRAILPGEPERAGRWWWEQEDKRECGLHVAPDGRLVRANAGSN